MKFQGKVAVVTGGSRGIGRAIVLALAGEGAKVAFCARREDEEAEKLVRDVAALGTEALFVRADITDRGDVADMVKTVEERLGAVDILVNNAGWGVFGRFLQADDAVTDREIDINLKGPINVTKAVLRGMVSRGSGKVVNIASESGRIGTSGSCVYSAAKGGVIAFTKALAREVARYKINVNCVSPGMIWTETLAHTFEDKSGALAAVNKTIPWGRPGQPEEIAAAVTFLASDEAAYITGQTLSVSGGATMF